MVASDWSLGARQIDCLRSEQWYRSRLGSNHLGELSFKRLLHPSDNQSKSGPWCIHGLHCECVLHGSHRLGYPCFLHSSTHKLCRGDTSFSNLWFRDNSCIKFWTDFKRTNANSDESTWEHSLRIGYSGRGWQMRKVNPRMDWKELQRANNKLLHQKHSRSISHYNNCVRNHHMLNYSLEKNSSEKENLDLGDDERRSRNYRGRHS
jgi:hypothetical protein